MGWRQTRAPDLRRGPLATVSGTMARRALAGATYVFPRDRRESEHPIQQDGDVTTTHAEIPHASAVAQQIHYDETAMHPLQAQPPWHAAAAALVPDASTPRTIRKAIGCILRPYPTWRDDNDPEAGAAADRDCRLQRRGRRLGVAHRDEDEASPSDVTKP